MLNGSTSCKKLLLPYFSVYQLSSIGVKMPFSIKVIFYRILMVLLKFVTVFIPAPKPTIYSGAGSAKKMCSTISHFGADKLLIVTDSMLVKIGVVEEITAELERLGIQYVVFDEILPDPSYGLVEKGVQVALENQATGILAIGGGSPIDAAKVIAARATNSKSIKELTGILKVKQPCLPLFVVPTTAGTGSETTIAAVVSNPSTNQKTPVIDPKLVPVAAALDPTLMLGLPPAITAATGMDALTHAVESYLSKHAAPDTDHYALAAVKMIMKNLPICYEDGKNIEARESMALASFYAGAAFTKANLGYVHAIAHQFGAYYHTPHGLANAIVLPYVLEYSLPAAHKRLAQLAIAIDLGVEGEPHAVLAQRFVDAVKQLNEKIGIPSTLEELKSQDVSQIAKGALKEAHYLYPVPRYMDKSQCEQIIRDMLPASV